jgi:hypothetical protein
MNEEKITQLILARKTQFEQALKEQNRQLIEIIGKKFAHEHIINCDIIKLDTVKIINIESQNILQIYIPTLTGYETILTNLQHFIKGFKEIIPSIIVNICFQLEKPLPETQPQSYPYPVYISKRHNKIPIQEIKSTDVLAYVGCGSDLIFQWIKNKIYMVDIKHRFTYQGPNVQQITANGDDWNPPEEVTYIYLQNWQPLNSTIERWSKKHRIIYGCNSGYVLMGHAIYCPHIKGPCGMKSIGRQTDTKSAPT